MTDLLDTSEYLRYGRQMLVPEFGFPAQLLLKKSHVLVIGAGGLGCPAIPYLAGSGIGYLSIVDGDIVEESNLHRQVIHSTETVGMPKAKSAKRFVQKLNDKVKVKAYCTPVTNQNIFNILNGGNNISNEDDDSTDNEQWKKADVVLDCTDNPATRYLISDAAVILGIPLVSASALKTEGQISVLNYLNGPCYRCFYPNPPPANAVVACGDGGILGPVVGMMGVYQALEAIKIISKVYEPSNDNEEPIQKYQPSLAIFSALAFPPWRCIRMRGKKTGCISCDSSCPNQIKQAQIEDGSLDYQSFCGATCSTLSILPKEKRISASEYEAKYFKSGKPHVLIDVRPKVQYEICALPNSINIPLEDFPKLSEIKEKTTEKARLWSDLIEKEPIITVCRRGNNSQIAVTKIEEYLQNVGVDKPVIDIIGGVTAWSKDVDPNFPIY